MRIAKWIGLAFFTLLWLPAFGFSLLGLGFGGWAVLSPNSIIHHNGWFILATFLINPLTVALIGYAAGSDRRRP